MKVVTGGAGFIGSNLVKKLNDNDCKDILIVDDLTDGKKIKNLAGLDFVDFINIEDFLIEISSSKSLKDNIEVIFHQGACSSTTEWNGKYLMSNNYEYSKKLLHFSSEHNIQFIYASSASVYGDGINGFSENRLNENPINMYAFSKFQFDQYVRDKFSTLKNQIIGLRYFNVYGPGESLKGGQASAIYHFISQAMSKNEISLFGESDGYKSGEQMRDFIHVDDCVDINLWFFKNPNVSGIYNVGTGKASSFNKIANCILDIHGSGSIKYINFPDGLKDFYQSFTEADNKNLLSNYKKDFISIEDGVRNYYSYMNSK